MEKITATKDGMTKQFSNEAWSLLGGNTNGWKRVSDSSQSVTNEVELPTGNKPDEVKGSNTNNQNVDNETISETKTEESQSVSNEVAEDKKEEVKTEEAELSFTELAKKIKRNQIKDFLDGKEVSYKQNAPIGDLIDLLSETLKADVTELKTLFNL